MLRLKMDAVTSDIMQCVPMKVAATSVPEKTAVRARQSKKAVDCCPSDRTEFVPLND